MQSKLGSIIEIITSTVFGFLVAIAAQIYVFPMYGWEPQLQANFEIAFIFTAVSIVRGYVWRRGFNWAQRHWHWLTTGDIT